MAKSSESRRILLEKVCELVHQCDLAIARKPHWIRVPLAIMVAVWMSSSSKLRQVIADFSETSWWYFGPCVRSLRAFGRFVGIHVTG